MVEGKKIVFIVLAIVIAAILMGGCGQQQAKGSRTDKDTIVLGIENESEKINPIFADEHDDAVYLIFSGLVRFNEQNEPVPDLATSWTVSADRLIYTFALRKDVKWHDGNPFTANDVKFTIEQSLDPKNNSKIQERFEEIKEVQIINPYTVKIVLKHPFPRLLDVMATGVIPKHLLAGKDINNARFNMAPIGTGPFKYSKWEKGQYLILTANKDFYRGSPKSAKVILKFLPDQNIRAFQLETGEIDVALIDPMQVQRLANNPKLTVQRMKTADYRVMMYNLAKPLWQDSKVRQALNYAVDKEALVKGILLGWGKVADGPLQMNWANVPINKYKYDPEKAKQLLSQAGWHIETDGFWYKDGNKFSFKLTTFAHDPVRVAIVSALSTQFKNIGIEAIPDPRQKGSFKINEMDTFLLGWGSPYDPDEDTYRLFHSSQIGKLNFQNYSNAKVDDYLLKARKTGKRNERRQLYNEFQQELSNDPPFNFLVYLDVAVVAKQELKGIKSKILGHHGAGFIWNIEEWSK